MELSRQPLRENDLLQLLNWELAAYEECDGCHVTAIDPAAEDGSGGNWSAAHIEGGALTGQRIARQIVAQTRLAYNLAR